MSESQCRGNSFVLRIWWEEHAHPTWRGWVQHTSTGEYRYFQHLSDLLTFVEDHTGSLAHASDEMRDSRRARA